MGTRPDRAVLFIWENAQPFGIDHLVYLLGGLRRPTEAELAARRSGSQFLCTEDFRLYHATKEEDTFYQECRIFDRYMLPHFSTVMLELRLSSYGLQVPDHEISFFTRGLLSLDDLNADGVIDASACLAAYNLDFLCVLGISIKEGRYLASNAVGERIRTHVSLGIRYT